MFPGTNLQPIARNSIQKKSTNLIAKQPYIGTQTGIETVRALVQVIIR
jgi:hypothetical protein